MAENKNEHNYIYSDIGRGVFRDDILENKTDDEVTARRQARLDKQASKAKDPEVVKRNKQRRRRLFLGFLVVVFVVAFAFRTIQQMIELDKEEARVQAELDSLIKKESELQDVLEQVDSDEYVEQTARSEKHMIMPGETMYVVVQEEEKPASDATEKSGEDEEQVEAKPSESANT